MRAALALLFAMPATLGGAASCVASQAPNLPPPIESRPADGSLFGDLPPAPVIKGPCPGHGTVSVSFDRGIASETCWSSYSTLTTPGGTVAPGQPTVAITGNPQSSPGLSVAIALFEGGARCSLGPGSKLALDGPCVFVTVAYGQPGGTAEWQAFGGAAVKSPIQGDASAASAEGTLLVESYSTTPGATLGVSFAPGSSLVLDAPGHPLVSISGSVTVPLE